MPRAGLGKPFLSVHVTDIYDELLELGGVESWEGDAGRGDEHAPGVTVGTKETQAAIEAAVELHAFEAFGCVVQAGGCGVHGEGAVGF